MDSEKKAAAPKTVQKKTVLIIAGLMVLTCIVSVAMVYVSYSDKKEV